MPKVRLTRITGLVSMVPQVARRHDTKRADRAQGANLRTAQFVLAAPVADQLALEATR